MAPTLKNERALWDRGFELVAGVDEVGRGAWAGPLTVGVVVVPQAGRVYKVRDSKMLSHRQRLAMVDRIRSWAVSWGVGHAWPHECDELGMSLAQKLAASRAISALTVTPDHYILDGRWNFLPEDASVLKMVKADAKCLSVSGASVVAKVERDLLMIESSRHYPYYEFESNKGYPSERHIASLYGYGPSTIHRKSWIWNQSLPYFRDAARLIRDAQQLSLL